MKKIAWGLLLCCFCFALAACGKKDANRQVMQLTIATMPSIDKVPLIVGIEKGFFADHGLQLTNQNFGSPTDRDAALQAGQVDGVMSDMVAAALYLEAGMKVKMTSVVQTGFGVLASRQSGITTLADIKAANTYGISLNGLIEYLADRAGTAQKVLLPAVSNRVEQLLAGKIDLTVVPEPYATMAAGKGAVLIATDRDLGVKAAVMLFTDRAISEKRAAIAAFYAGYQDSLNYLKKTDSKKYVALVIEKGALPAETGAVLSKATFTGLELPGQDQYQEIIAWMKSKPEFTGKYTIPFENAVDTTFLPK